MIICKNCGAEYDDEHATAALIVVGITLANLSRCMRT